MINRLLFLLLPVSLLALPFVFHLACEDSGFYFAKESGAVEIITAILLAVAIGVVLRFLSRLVTSKLAGSSEYLKLTILWSVIYFLGCVYFLGEEISWGQHLVGWETPEAWQEVNDQGETNLHNISGWLDQVPRTVLTIGIVFGGVVFPLMRRGDNQDGSVEKFLIHFMPGRNCIFAGVCVLAIVLLLSLTKVTGITLPPDTGGEVKESLIAMFLLVYIVDFSQRVLGDRRQETDVATAES